MSDSLAIVIPAFKRTFLSETLDTISKQTCKNFKLYIGDDASPHRLDEIIHEYSSKIDLVYKKFEENVGGQNLVAHWQRCIEMTGEERWIWLFSDDDLMDDRCVESFFQTTQRYDSDLYHFNVRVIDQSGVVKEKAPLFPERLSAIELFRLKCNRRIKSYAVEYIFSRKIYEQENGFQSFDLAWCSDDATWMKFGFDKDIITIADAEVHWRRSGENITSSVDEKMAIRKLDSVIQFLTWAKVFFQTKNVPVPSSYITIGFKHLGKVPSLNIEYVDVIRKIKCFHGGYVHAISDIIYFTLYRVYKSFSLLWK